MKFFVASLTIHNDITCEQGLVEQYPFRWVSDYPGTTDLLYQPLRGRPVPKREARMVRGGGENN